MRIAIRPSPASTPLRAAACVLAVAAAVAGTARAEEGGSSHYMPGTQGDVALALIGPKGLYVRNDTMYFTGKIQEVTLGGRVYASAEQDVVVDIVKGIWLGGRAPLGSRWGGVVSVPLVLDATVSGDLVAPIASSPEGSRSGLGDISVTGLLNWSLGEHHISFGGNVYVPTGSYEEGRVINLGRNYWSFDPTISWTWLQPAKGHEVSAVAGFMVNTENPATDYDSGDAFHLDFTIAQHVTKRLAVGVEGYWYRQVTDDRGPLLDYANSVLPSLGLDDLGGFRGEALGLGGVVACTASIGRKDVTFTLKYMTDLHRENRFDNDMLMLSFALKL